MARNTDDKRGMEALSSILERVMQDTLPAKGHEISRVWDVWSKAVGPDVAKNAQPKVMKKGLLIVNVASGPWAQELQFLEADIRDRVNSAAGVELVEEIRFKVGLGQQGKGKRKK